VMIPISWSFSEPSLKLSFSIGENIGGLSFTSSIVIVNVAEIITRKCISVWFKSRSSGL